jgi:hypothetical protein
MGRQDKEIQQCGNRQLEKHGQRWDEDIETDSKKIC